MFIEASLQEQVEPSQRLTSSSTNLEQQLDAPPATQDELLAPRRGCLEDVKVLKRGDVYIGRGSKQAGLGPSPWESLSGEILWLGRPGGPLPLLCREFQGSARASRSTARKKASVPLQSRKEVPRRRLNRVLRKVASLVFPDQGQPTPSVKEGRTHRGKGTRGGRKPRTLADSGPQFPRITILVVHPRSRVGCRQDMGH